MAWRFTQADVVGKQPPPRHLHASAVMDGALYVVGGQTRLEVLQDAWALRYDDQPYAWRKLKLQKTGKLLKNRIFFAHAAYGTKLYISGGSNHQNMTEVYDNIITLDTETETLSILETDAEGIERPRLSRHSMTAMGGSLWMVGGWDGYEWLDTTYRLDLYAQPRPRWTQLEADGFVPWRRSHCCLVPSPTAANTLLLFGGGDGDSDFDDVYYLHTALPGAPAQGYWGRVGNVTGKTDARTQMGCGVLPPGGRKGAGDDAHALVVHGGYGGGGQGRRLRALSLLSLGPGSKAWGWSDLRTSGALPGARMGHTLHAVNATLLLLFGGVTDDGSERPTGGATDELWLARPNRLVPAHELPPGTPAPSPPSSLVGAAGADAAASEPHVGAAAEPAAGAAATSGRAEARQTTVEARAVTGTASARVVVKELGVEEPKEKKMKKKKKKKRKQKGTRADKDEV